MPIYVARSPYRSYGFAQTRNRKFRLAFPKFGGLFKKGRAGRIDRNAQFIAHYEMGRNGGIKAVPNMKVDFKDVGRKVKGAVVNFRFSPAVMVITLMIVAGGLSVLYLAHFNMVATKGYDLKRLEANRQQLMGVYDVNNMRLAEAKSLTRIMASDRASVMRRPAEIIYVRPNTAVAMVP